MSSKKGIKREIAAYPSLKDERYFDGFKRSLFIAAKTHEYNEVLDPNYTPGSEPEEQEFFEAKQTFMFSVFNANLQTDMGKTIVRRHVASIDAHPVWNELSEHIRSSSNGASEKRRLTQYVNNIVLDDNFKSTTEQFVLHFNEQFRQFEEITEDDEMLPPTVKLTLLQTAVRSINDHRIVETLDEFQSTTYGHEVITRFHHRKVHNTEIVETHQDDPPGPVPENDPPDLPESDLDIPDDPNLDFVNSQCHNSEDLGQALQAYQAYQVQSPQDSTITPERSINHHFTYHIAQASQAIHGSQVDRGANGGLAGSDVRLLSRSSRKCTVTGIDSDELQGLDVVQCAALVQTNHGIVNLIMNEYACYGKGLTIHSSGQFEWFKNSVDDRSVQVGGKQRICTIDCYAMPLTCRGGLMYFSILGKPTDKDLERYSSVHIRGPHEWDPSVLDYTHPSGDGEPPWSNDPDERSTVDRNFDEYGDYTPREYRLSIFWMTLHPL